MRHSCSADASFSLRKLRYTSILRDDLLPLLSSLYAVALYSLRNLFCDISLSALRSLRVSLLAFVGIVISAAAPRATAASPEVYSFVVEGSDNYSGEPSGGCMYISDKSRPINFNADIENAFSFTFYNSGTTNLARLYKLSGKYYLRFYPMWDIRITPKSGTVVTKVVIFGTNDQSGGFQEYCDNGAKPAGKITNSAGGYTWNGSTSGLLRLRLKHSGNGFENQGFYHIAWIEVTYEKSVGKDPDPGNNPDNNPDNDTDKDTDKDGEDPAPDQDTDPTPEQLEKVTTLTDFFSSENAGKTMKLTMPLQLVYRYDDRAYMLNLDSNNREYLYVSNSNRVLDEITPGTTFDHIVATPGIDIGLDIANLVEPPVARGSRALPSPDTVRIGALTFRDINRYVAIKDARISYGSRYISQGNNTMPYMDRFEAVGYHEGPGEEVTVTGFVAVDGIYRLVIRPTKVEKKDEPSGPDNPDNPESPAKTVTLDATSIGNGHVEIFTAINEFTLTPAGAPLTIPSAIESGTRVYVWIRPDYDSRLASAVIGLNAYLPGDKVFTATPYGDMITIEVNSDLNIVTTFMPTSGIEAVNTDNDEAAKWFDLTGRRLPSRPTAPGVYILRTGAATVTVFVPGRQ